MIEGATGSALGNVVHRVDAAKSHPYAFLFMAVLVFILGIRNVKRETDVHVRTASLLNVPMGLYLIVLGFLMSLTTAMSLMILVNDDGTSKAGFMPDSFVSMVGAVFGVFAFGTLIDKFVIGFGENRLDVNAVMQDLIDQAVEATLRKEATSPQARFD